MTPMTVVLILLPLVLTLLAAWFHRYQSRINPPYTPVSGLPDFWNRPVGQVWPVNPDLGERQWDWTSPRTAS